MRAVTRLKMLVVFATIGILVSSLFAQRQPQAGNALGQNSALRYWQAFAHLPQLPPPGDTGPDRDEAKMVESGKDALLYLRRGAAIGPCDWGLHREDGPYLLLPHLAKGRDLGRLAGMKVRRDFAAGDGPGAAETGADAIVMARHLSTDLTAIISYLVQLSVERGATETLASRLAGIDPAALDALDRRLASLPPGGSLESCVRVERELGIGWAVNQLRQMKDQDPWKERVIAPYVTGEGGGASREKIDALVAAAGGTREGALEQFEALLPYYDGVGKIITLPREQFRAKLAELEKRTESNAFAKAVLPAMARFYDNEAAGRTRLTMLRAAVAVVRGGPDRAKEFKDAASSPLEYRATPDGFELTSKVIEHDKPVTLKVGGRR